MRKWLKNLRVDKGLTQAEVAEKMDVVQSYYAMIETGERQKELDISTAQKIADVFEVSISYIIEQEQKLKAN